MTQASRTNGLSTTWVASRFGLDPVRVNALRRAGELYAVRSPGSTEWIYPAWQFAGDGVKSDVARFFAAAREQGLTGTQVGRVLQRRIGMVGGRTVLDILLRDGPERAIAALR
jgi:hypothetical protein